MSQPNPVTPNAPQPFKKIVLLGCLAIVSALSISCAVVIVGNDQPVTDTTRFTTLSSGGKQWTAGRVDEKEQKGGLKADQLTDKNWDKESYSRSFNHSSAATSKGINGTSKLQAEAVAVKVDRVRDVDSRASGEKSAARRRGVDFLVAGFAKCGTTTLLYTFLNHTEIDFAKQEYCVMGHGARSPVKSVELLNNMMKKEFPAGSDNIRGIKCPNSIRYIRSLQLLEYLNPETKVIVGVRHPVLFFQSYYNYRVVELLREPKKNKGKKIPDPYSLVGNSRREWKGVFTDLARYEHSLMQMGKVKLTRADKRQLRRQGLLPVKVSLPLFLYDVEQLSDPDEERSSKFRTDLQKFLGLKTPWGAFDQRNSLSNKKSFAQKIDICEPKFKKLRDILVHHGDNTRHWIRDKFLASDEVFIGGDRHHFLEIMSRWGEDPCSWNQTSTSRM